MARLYASLYERLVANTIVDEDGCWIWQGVIAKANGYPRLAMRVPGRSHPVQVAAHRKMLEITTGWLFPFDEAGHKCYKQACIRPDCLRIETRAENMDQQRNRIGYNHDGRWIPVLFPTPERLLDEAAERAWEGIGTVVHPIDEPCPF